MARRPNSALLVIDVQNDVVAAAHQRDQVVSNIATLVETARFRSVPVIWIQHDDDELPAETDGWQIVDELKPTAAESIVRKNYRDSFEATELDAQLEALDVGRLVITGAQTDYCVRWTLHGALSRGYDTVLVGDGHTTDAVSPDGLPNGDHVVRHTNQVWASQDHPNAKASVVNSADVEF